MSATLQIELNEAASKEVLDLASALQRTPEQVKAEILFNGIHALRRFAYYKKRSETVDIADVLATLDRCSGDEPPSPGDELPDGYVRRT